jgi:hypothetical protein
MHVDALAVQLRPRLMTEAADLGVRLVQANARSLLRSYGPVYALVAVLALGTVELAGWLPGLIVFWLKPWLDRSLLFVLSRAVFGQATHLDDLWRAARTVWWGGLLPALTLRRLSPWRAYTQPAHQLEGLHGRARRLRRRQLLNGKGGAALGLQLVFSQVTIVLAVALMMLVYWLTPPAARSQVFQWFLQGEHSTLVALMVSAPYVLVVGLVEPFYVAAGFAMYLNRRVELEAWDVEQELRRVFAA